MSVFNSEVEMIDELGVPLGGTTLNDKVSALIFTDPEDTSDIVVCVRQESHWENLSETRPHEAGVIGALISTRIEGDSVFQERIDDWLVDCFGEDVASDTQERTHRFIEESLELAQAAGCSKEHALRILEYVYSRPEGEIKQEVGGTMVTLAALCCSLGIAMNLCGELEYKRINDLDVMRKIRKKHLTKPLLSKSVIPFEILISDKLDDVASSNNNDDLLVVNALACLLEVITDLASQGELELSKENFVSHLDIDKFGALSLDKSIPGEYRSGMWALLRSVGYLAPSEDHPSPVQKESTLKEWEAIVEQFKS